MKRIVTVLGIALMVVGCAAGEKEPIALINPFGESVTPDIPTLKGGVLM